MKTNLTISCPVHKVKISKMTCRHNAVRTHLFETTTFYPDTDIPTECDKSCEHYLVPTDGEVNAMKEKTYDRVGLTGRYHLNDSTIGKSKRRRKAERNAEILRLFKAGVSKTEIVERLNVPAHRVKWFLHTIGYNGERICQD